jgi:ribosome-interacting GTPase 1
LLCEEIWHKLKLVRIFTKPAGQIPDFDDPVVMREGRTSVLALMNRLHKQMHQNFKYAIVWGRSVRFPGQKVGKDHVLEDEDVVQIVKSR